MKKKRWYEWLYLAFFVLFSVLILTEAGMNGTSSGRQSKTFSFLFDGGKNDATIVLPTSVFLKGETEAEIGHHVSYSVVFTPENTSDKRVSYSLEQEGNVAELEGNVLIPLNEGSAVLKATSLANPSLTSELNISVKKEKITSLKISLDTEETLVAGMTSQIQIESNVSSLSLDDVVFSSSEESVASVDSKGLVRTEKPGKARLSVSTSDGSVKSNVLTLSVSEGDFVPVSSLRAEETEFYAKNSTRIVPLFNEEASDRRYTVSSRDGRLLVEEDQSLTSSLPGTYSYTVTSVSNPEISTTGSVTVKEVRAKGISFPDAAVRYGETATLSYSLIPDIAGEEVTDTGVLFSISDSSMAEVSGDGHILGLKKGSVKVTVAWKKDPSVKAEAEIAVSSLTPAEFNRINAFVRKFVGHFSLFLLTGLSGALVLCSFFLKTHGDSLFKTFLGFSVLLIYGLVLASVSEGFQIFAGGRGPSWNDVGIDFSGYALSVLVFLAIYALFVFYRKKKTGAGR